MYKSKNKKVEKIVHNAYFLEIGNVRKEYKKTPVFNMTGARGGGDCGN